MGVSDVVFELQARWPIASNSTLAGAAVPAATFQVQLPGSSSWIPMCSDLNGTCGGTCTGGGCNYSYTLPSGKAAAYTVQFRAALSGAAGDPTAASFSYVQCDSSHYADIDEADGAVTCLPCPPGGNCAVVDVTTIHDIVALPGWCVPNCVCCVHGECSYGVMVPLSFGLTMFGCIGRLQIVQATVVVSLALTNRWSPPNSDGLTFYTCPIVDACLPGLNGSRSTCAIGYGSIACRYAIGNSAAVRIVVARTRSA